MSILAHFSNQNFEKLKNCNNENIYIIFFHFSTNFSLKNCFSICSFYYDCRKYLISIFMLSSFYHTTTRKNDNNSKKKLFVFLKLWSEHSILCQLHSNRQSLLFSWFCSLTLSDARPIKISKTCIRVLTTFITLNQLTKN